MARSRSLTCWGRVWLGALLLTLAAVGAPATSPKRVLLLDPFGRNVAPFTTVVSSFRTTLARELGEPVDIYELPLELARFAGPEAEDPLVTFLDGRLKEQAVDLVVPVGTAGMQFAARHRERLFPKIPILVLASEARMVSPDFLRSNATLVTQKVSLPGMVEDILQIQPRTTNIVVVLGASTLERFWTEQCQREFQVFTNRVAFTWVNDLTLDQILELCAALPPHSFVLHVLFIVDAAGVPCERNEALVRLHQVANAPVFGYYTSEFGLGSIGGRLFQDTEVGAQAARTAIRILRGENAGNFPPQVLEPTAPVFDWRELERWGVNEANLPAGSVIHFRQPSLWERYRWLVAGTSMFCVLQAALIVGLLVNRARRRESEAAAALIAAISSRFVGLAPGEVDREIREAERRICELLGLEVSSLWQWSAEAPNVLALTHFYWLLDDPPTPEGMTAAEFFPWCQAELQAGRNVVLPSLDALPADAARDRETFHQFGIKAALVLPLSVGREAPVGALAFGAVRAKRGWPEVLVKRLQVLAEIVANALARRRADHALRESEERMTLAADSAQFGVWVWNLGRNEVWASERWLGLFGFAAGRAIRFEGVIERIHPDDRETVEREVRRALADRSDYAGEFRAVLPDGTQRWIASRGRGYPDANGVPARMMGAAIDITERKRGEEALRLSEARLAHAGRVTLLGQLASALAHELSQPLGAMLRNAEAAEIMLREPSPDLEELRAIVADILRDDHRAGDVIDRLRSLLKRGSMSPLPVDLGQVVGEVLSLLRGDAAARHVRVESSMAPNLPLVLGDRTHLQQVLINLLVNAMDALDGVAQDKRLVRVRIRPAGAAAVEVEVADKGHGIAKEHLPRLFEPFFTTKGSGMGIGLAVSKTIIEAHKGKLWAENDPAGGARFRFTVPVGSGAAIPPSSA